MSGYLKFLALWLLFLAVAVGIVFLGGIPWWGGILVGLPAGVIPSIIALRKGWVTA